MTTYLYSPADNRGWGLGESTMRDYYLIGGALQPSDVYTVRVREHWRRKRGTARPRAVVASVAPVVPAVTVRRARKRAIAIPTTRLLRSATRAAAPAVPVAPGALVPAVAPAPAVPFVASPGGFKRRRLT
ncbi:pVII [Psittacine adenovirus 2]|uniref:PVII n=2 Tax=root TaxID=1 RepID=A0ABX8SPC4_9ADEN|nr:pVII [Psittacine adenovirus 2]QZW33248.1 ORF09 pVII [Psittacine siadenovirus F]QXX30953.1 pVII [Psittacine adenovirus 2]QZW33692.1 ORF09 pVII [Psittacine adenovirus 2]WGL41017.1 pVII [Psittacine siadenovirus F]